MSNDELKAQFKRCEQWQDADQWDWLGVAYYQCGYLLNALHCFKRADACRLPMPLEMDVDFSGHGNYRRIELIPVAAETEA